ncbi:unnamed protein product [Moneuplotes crassus]|uniref:Uncharacterized protein n=1 Tax=Euplotes crassus TaxID=5936 RepID=A0AAD2D5E6_EUPCR|nr:unnamed protein product [Moneuplotes crassus]
MGNSCCKNKTFTKEETSYTYKISKNKKKKKRRREEEKGDMQEELEKRQGEEGKVGEGVTNERNYSSVKIVKRVATREYVVGYDTETTRKRNHGFVCYEQDGWGSDHHEPFKEESIQEERIEIEEESDLQYEGEIIHKRKKKDPKGINPQHCLHISYL